MKSRTKKSTEHAFTPGRAVRFTVALALCFALIGFVSCQNIFLQKLAEKPSTGALALTLPGSSARAADVAAQSLYTVSVEKSGATVFTQSGIAADSTITVPDLDPGDYNVFVEAFLSTWGGAAQNPDNISILAGSGSAKTTVIAGETTVTTVTLDKYGAVKLKAILQGTGTISGTGTVRYWTSTPTTTSADPDSTATIPNVNFSADGCIIGCIPPTPNDKQTVFSVTLESNGTTYTGLIGTEIPWGDLKEVFVPVAADSSGSSSTAAYTVKYMTEKLPTGTGSSPEYEEYGSPLTGLSGAVGEQTNATAPSITGFTAQPVTQQTILADGSTVVTIYYDRNEITLTLNLDGGTGSTGLTGKYGATVPGVTNPTKTDYTFTGWEPALPTTFPAENTTYTAQWIQLTYTVSNEGELQSAITTITRTNDSYPRDYTINVTGTIAAQSTTDPLANINNTSGIEILNLTIAGVADSSGGYPILQGFADASQTANTALITVSGAVDLTLKDLSLTGTNCSGNGGAVYAEPGTTVTFDNVHAYGNKAQNGGVIYSSDKVVLKNGTVFGDATATEAPTPNTVGLQNTKLNHASNNGGAIHMARGSSLTVEDGCIIAYNYSGLLGGGIYADQTSSLCIGEDGANGDVSIRYNTGINGGGIFIQGASGSITKTTFRGNNAVDGGGLYAKTYTDADPSVQSSIQLTDVSFYSNTVSNQNGVGKGIYVDSTSKIVVSGTISMTENDVVNDVYLEVSSSTGNEYGVIEVASGFLTTSSITITPGDYDSGSQAYVKGNGIISLPNNDVFAVTRDNSGQDFIIDADGKVAQRQ